MYFILLAEEATAVAAGQYGLTGLETPRESLQHIMHRRNHNNHMDRPKFHEANAAQFIQ